MKLVSVIVAAYNIERYIVRCVNSILASTYTDLQVIVIDDGSQDRTGTLLDDYEDERLEIIHTSNHGVSAARNLGLDRAKGDFVLFVDGDDYIAPQMIEEMVAVSAHMDIVETTQFFANDTSTWRKPYQTNCQINGVNLQVQKEACLSLTLAPHSRLYAKKLVEDVRFPLGLVYEDNYFISMLFPRLTNVYKLETKNGYYHYQREGSTTLSFDNRIFDMLAIQEAIKKAYIERGLWEEYYLILEKNAVHDLLYSTLGRKFAHYQGEANLLCEYQKIVSFIRSVYPHFMRNPYLSKQEKLISYLTMKGWGGVRIVNALAKRRGY